MLKVKGFSNGFLNPILEIPCVNEVVHVGLFSIGANPVLGGAPLGDTGGMVMRSVGRNFAMLLQGDCKTEKTKIVEERRCEVAGAGEPGCQAWKIAGAPGR